MTQHSLLQPVAVLLAWSMVMFVWMYATRIPAMRRAGLDATTRVGGMSSDLDQALPERVQWKAHNYNHLMEQPTLFYAACFLLVLAGCGSPVARYAAWAYVGLRIVHSLVQVLSNRIIYRFAIFILSSICLMILIGFAICSVF